MSLFAYDFMQRALLGVLITGLSAASSWQTWLLFDNRTSFHTPDPQFHLDLSFFVFTPQALLGTAVLVTLTATVAGAYPAWLAARTNVALTLHREVT